MIKQIKKLKQSPLFNGIPYHQFENMIEQLDSQLKYYRSKQTVIQPGRRFKRPGVVLEGSLLVYQVDFWGNKECIDIIHEGEIFGETIAFSNHASSTSIEAETASTILWFDLNDFLTIHTEEIYRQKVIRNFMSDFANKNYQLQKKLTHLTKRSTKEKILAYLSDYSRQIHLQEFDIPYSRQQFADYLGVERSALSTQINQLAKEKYFIVNQRHFILLHDKENDSH